MKPLSKITQQLVEYGGGLVLLSALHLISSHSYVLFHSLIELVSVVIASAAFLLVWNSRRLIENTFYLVMGIGFLFVALFGLLHTLTCKEMKLLLGNSSNISMQFWIIGHYFEGFTLLLALTLQQRRVSAGYLLLAYTLTFISLLLIIFQYNIFPIFYQENVGLTTTYRTSELVTVVLLGCALFFVYRKQPLFDPQLHRWLVLAIIFSILAELLYALQKEIEDSFNLLGHYSKLISFYLIYKAIIEISLIRPFNSLFYEKQREIEQRCKTEQALRNQEYLLRSIIDSTPRFIFWKDIHSTYLGCNESFAQLVGLDSPAQIAGKTDFDLIWQLEDIKKFRADDQRIMQMDQAEYNFVEPFYQVGTERRWASTSKIPLHAIDGQVIGIACIVEDITQRKEAEALLQQSEARYRAIVEEQTDLICRFLPDTTLTFVNEAYCRYFNVKAQDILGKTFLTLIPKDSHQTILDYLQQLLTRIPSTFGVSYEHQVITPSGEWAWQQWVDRAILDSDGKIVEFQSVGRDITRSKQMEEALRKNEAKLNAILDNLPVMVSSTDTQGNIVLWNRECERVTGYDANEIVNNPKAWNILCTEETKQTFCYHSTLYETGQIPTHRQREWTLLCKNGVKKTIAWSITYVDIPELTALAIGQDITERKKVEQALRMSQMRLAEAQQIAHLGNWEWDFITGEQQCSDEMFRIFGLSPEQDNFTLETFENSLYPDDSEFVLAAIGRAIYQGEPYNLECRIIRPGDKVTRHIQTLGQVTRTLEGHLHRLIGTVQDITERKHIEEALQESEALLNAIFNVAKVGLCVTDQEGQFVRVNQAYSELYGYQVRELLGQHFTLVLPAADRERANRLYHNFLAGKIEELPSDWLVKDKNGHLRNVYVTAGRLIRRDQQCFKVTSVVDVTTRNQMEKALRQSEERFELAMLGANDGLWDWNLETNEVYLSPRFKQQLGFQEEIPLTLEEALELLHPEDVVPFITTMTAYLEKKTFTYENIQRMRHQQGHYLWILNRALAVRDARGNPLRMVGTHVDITAQKQIEQKLKIANTELRQFKTTLDLTLDSVFMFDTQSLQFLYVNQGAIYQLGYTEAELLNMTLAEVDTHVKQEGLKNLNHAHPIQKYETLHQCKNGQQVPVEIFLQYVQIVEQPARVIGIGRDITERKQADLKLQQAKEAAEVANRAKSVFLANMSHELRTPLNSILGYAQILKQDTGLTAEQMRRIDIIYHSGEYLLTLISDVLDLAKIEAGRIEICPTIFLFNEFLKSITELFEVRAKQKGIAFIYHPLSFLPSKVLADERRLRQILINLLGNAIKFTHHGKVTLKVGYHEGKMRFQIEDTGIGIASPDIEKIFLPFQQVGNASYHVEGTGLGLSITKKLVETMGGELHVESVVHKGSKFWFTLQLPEVATLTLPGQVEKPTIVGYKHGKHAEPSIKILVIDDREENRSVLVNLLTPLGFKVSEARNGQEGLVIARRLRPQLIFLDLVMPVMDGFETVHQIRKSPLFDKTVVIAVSASVFDYYQHKSLRAGCNGFISKPVHLEELLNCLKKQLDIEWIYGETPLQSLVRTNLTPPQDEAIVVKPNAEQATVLYELARRGDINGVVAFAQKLIQTDEKLTPFANRIFDLAENLQKKKIIEFIQSFVDI